MTVPKVSIIIPVYNAESTIGRCLESIRGQTFQDFEVFLIDDGSSDNSFSICKDFAKSDQRITVLHQSNSGPSSARNHALNYATGQYVYFADSDDHLEPDLLENMLHCLADTHSSLAFLRYNLIDEDSGEEIPNTRKYNYPTARNLSATETLQLLLPDNFPSFVWSFMAERRLFNDSPVIRFPQNILREDQAILYKLVDRADSIGFVQRKLYNYHIRGQSLLGSKSESTLMITSVIELVTERQCYLDEHRPKLRIQTGNANIALLLYVLKTTENIKSNRQAKALRQKCISLVHKYMVNIGIRNVNHDNMFQYLILKIGLFPFLFFIKKTIHIFFKRRISR